MIHGRRHFLDKKKIKKKSQWHINIRLDFINLQVIVNSVYWPKDWINYASGRQAWRSVSITHGNHRSLGKNVFPDQLAMVCWKLLAVRWKWLQWGIGCCIKNLVITVVTVASLHKGHQLAYKLSEKSNINSSPSK